MATLQRCVSCKIACTPISGMIAFSAHLLVFKEGHQHTICCNGQTSHLHVQHNRSCFQHSAALTHQSARCQPKAGHLKVSFGAVINCQLGMAFMERLVLQFYAGSQEVLSAFQLMKLPGSKNQKRIKIILFTILTALLKMLLLVAAEQQRPLQLTLRAVKVEDVLSLAAGFHQTFNPPFSVLILQPLSCAGKVSVEPVLLLQLCWCSCSFVRSFRRVFRL